MGVTVSKIAGSFALEVSGLDLEREISGADRDTLVAAWIDAGVLVFRRAANSADAHLRLGSCFGALERSLFSGAEPDENPYLLPLVEDPDSPKAMFNNVDYRGAVRVGFQGWHWDQSFVPRSVRGAVLRMVDKPAIGGETAFLDAAAAYDRLPQALRRRIDDLEVVYQYRRIFNPLCFPLGVTDISNAREDAELRERFPATVHPMVIAQPETGRKILRLSPMFAHHVPGWSVDDSQELFAEITPYLVDESHAYFHDWDSGDLVAWDNWRILHSARGVPVGERRTVHRIAIAADRALGRYLDPQSSVQSR